MARDRAAEDDEDRSKRRGTFVPYALLSPGMLWLTLFFLVPLYTLARASLSVKEGRFDFEPTFSWEWSNFSNSISDYSSQFWRSFIYAGAATVLCILIGYPLAFVVVTRGGRYKNALIGLVVVPFFTSFLIRTLAWQAILNDRGPILSAVRKLHLIGLTDFLQLTHDGRVLSTNVAVVGGLTYNFLPFMILPIYVSLEKIDLRLIEAAKDLYSNGWDAFRKVVLPLSLPGVFAGTLLTFIPAAGDFVNARFLGSPNQSMIGTVVQDRFLVQLDYPTAAALSFVLMAIITAGTLVYARLLGTDDLV